MKRWRDDILRELRPWSISVATVLLSLVLSPLGGPLSLVGPLSLGWGIDFTLYNAVILSLHRGLKYGYARRERRRQWWIK
jgi:hypothetical protein